MPEWLDDNFTARTVYPQSLLEKVTLLHLTAFQSNDKITNMPKIITYTIKQLHDDTGPLVRRAAAARRPIPITDRGQEVAVIASRSLLRPHARKRTLLPEYEAMMAEMPGNDVQEALDAIRGDR